MKRGDLVCLSQDKRYTGIILKVENSRYHRDSMGNVPALKILVFWNENLPENYSYDGVYARESWIIEDLIEVIHETG